MSSQLGTMCVFLLCVYCGFFCSMSLELLVKLNSNVFDRGCYFQVGRSVQLGMSIATAFRTALQTWASWVDRMINPEKTRIFFRTFEPSHWRYLAFMLNNSSPCSEKLKFSPLHPGY